VELIVVSAILGVLAIMVIPAYNRFVEVVKVSRCSSEIRGLEKDVYAYFVDKNVLPASLNDIGRSGLLDPWGNAYQYLQGGGARVLFGNPLNDDFDLYSKGQNGVSPASILDADSQDDVVRAREGGWVGSVVTFFD
jgi:general secretion pathway protein G